MNIKTLGISVLSLAAIAAIDGCGGSPQLGLGANPRVRVVDALSAPAAVSVTINGTAIPDVTQFDQSSSYQVVTNGNRTVTFTNAVSGSTVVSQSSLFQVNGLYTAIGFQGASGAAIMVLQDSNHADSAHATLRFEKVAAGIASSVDVYVTAPGASLSGAIPTFASVTLGNSSQSYQVFTSGTYEVRETAAGSKTAFIDQQMTLNGGTATTILDNGTTAFLSLQDQ